jgi:2-polyprenyl-3-methyl-5-hydroxy-6-metoxy-1,4-benzoquinol methylase
MESSDLEHIYRDLPPEKIPWNRPEPPEVLVKAIAGGRVKPCKAVDLGCGVGNYSIWLAEQGFDVTGIDIAHAAIDLAQARAARKGVHPKFLVTDLSADHLHLPGPFEFAFEYEVLHHIHPEFREKYISNVRSLLTPGALYLAVCFSINDPNFGGTGKYRNTTIGTNLYFSDREELQELYERYFSVLELREVRVPGGPLPHLAWCAFLKS